VHDHHHPPCGDNRRVERIPTDLRSRLLWPTGHSLDRVCYTRLSAGRGPPTPDTTCAASDPTRTACTAACQQHVLRPITPDDGPQSRDHLVTIGPFDDRNVA
jgi:hypothetical protein